MLLPFIIVQASCALPQNPVTFLFVFEFNSLTLMDFVLTLCLEWPLNSSFDWALCLFNLCEAMPEKFICEVSVKGKYPCPSSVCFPSMIEQCLNPAFSNAYATPVRLFVCLCFCLVELSYQFISIENIFMSLGQFCYFEGHCRLRASTLGFWAANFGPLHYVISLIREISWA